MKKILLTAVILFVLFCANETKAATHVSNAISRYENQYYYYPEVDLYYDVSGRRFIYFGGNRWVYTSELPSSYTGYDVSRGFKVAINEYKPYLHGEDYRQLYRSYYDNYHHISNSSNDHLTEERRTYPNNGLNQNNNAREYVYPSSPVNKNNSHSEEIKENKSSSIPSAEENSAAKENMYTAPSNNKKNAHPEEPKENKSLPIPPSEEKNVLKENMYTAPSNNKTNVHPEELKENKSLTPSLPDQKTVSPEHISSPNNNTKEYIYPAPATNKPIDRSEEIKENKSAAPPKDKSIIPVIPVLPPANNNIASPKKETADSAQRMQQFYNNGSLNGTRDAVRNPKFIKPVQDSARHN